MSTLTDNRLANLRMIVERDGLASAARRFEKPDRQLNDMLAGRKSFGEKVARAMEESYDPSRPPGWLDITPTVAGEFKSDSGGIAVIEASADEAATLEDRIDHASAAVVSVLKAASLDALCFGDIESIKAAMKSGPQETYSLEEILRAAVQVFVEEHDKIEHMNEDELCQVITAFLRNAREVTQSTKKK